MKEIYDMLGKGKLLSVLYKDTLYGNEICKDGYLDWSCIVGKENFPEIPITENFQSTFDELQKGKNYFNIEVDENGNVLDWFTKLEELQLETLEHWQNNPSSDFNNYLQKLKILLGVEHVT